MAYGPVITLDITLFRSRFAPYADPATYPDAALNTQWVVATQFISDSNYGALNDAGRELGIQYMLAHILALADIAASGGGTGQAGIVTAATIDKVSVTLAAPPYGTDEWRYWLNLTPYGVLLLALLSANAVGGFYIPGGPPERSAFRKGWGVF